jgi:hypothetical protein
MPTACGGNCTMMRLDVTRQMTQADVRRITSFLTRRREDAKEGISDVKALRVFA